MIYATLLICAVALCKATQDTLWHHWDRSLFARISGRTGYWGHASEVWKRRYVDNDPSRGYRPILRSALARAVLVPVWDGWHLVALVRSVALAAIPASLGAPLWTVPVLALLHSAVFLVAYNLLD